VKEGGGRKGETLIPAFDSGIMTRPFQALLGPFVCIQNPGKGGKGGKRSVKEGVTEGPLTCWWNAVRETESLSMETFEGMLAKRTASEGSREKRGETEIFDKSLR